MKMLPIVAIVAALSSGTPELRDTSWLQVSAPGSAEILECPIRLEFKEKKYTYINKCTGAGKNHVVEFGKYALSTGTLSLDDRFVVVGSGSIFGEDAAPVVLQLTALEDSTMRIQYGDKTVFLVSER